MKGFGSTLQSNLFGIDTRALAVFRMALGALLVTDSLLRLSDVGNLLSDAGALSRSSVLQWNPLWGIYFLNGSAAWSGTLLIIAAAVGVLLALGYKPRLMVIVSWFLLRCLHERAQTNLQGGDILLRFLLIWAAFLPLGAAWSLGRCRKSVVTICTRAVICNAATAALLTQTAIIYLSSVLTKSPTAWWTVGDLLWWDLQDPMLTDSLGTKLLAYPYILPTMIRSGYLLEWVALPLAFLPWKTATVRTWLVFSMWGFHLLGIGLIFSIGLFPWISAASWIVFLPNGFWDRMEQWFTSSTSSLPLRTTPPVITAMPKAATVLVGLMLAGMIGWNATWIGVHRMGKLFPKWVADYARSVPLHQGWDLFCFALTNDTWLVVAGTTVDGKTVDLQHPGSVVLWGPESLPKATMTTYRWRKYLSCVSGVRYEVGAKHYADFLCRRWESQTGIPLAKAELWRITQYRRPPDGSAPKPTEKKLFFTLNWGDLDKELSTPSFSKP